MGTAIKHPVPDRVKPSFVIFDIRALWRSGLSVASECPDVKNYKWRLNPVWHRMLSSCTHMATVGVKGLITCRHQFYSGQSSTSTARQSSATSYSRIHVDGHAGNGSFDQRNGYHDWQPVDAMFTDCSALARPSLRIAHHRFIILRHNY